MDGEIDLGYTDRRHLRNDQVRARSQCSAVRYTQNCRYCWREWSEGNLKASYPP